MVLPGRRTIIGSADRVSAQEVAGGTRLAFDTRRTYGATISVTVRGHGVV